MENEQIAPANGSFEQKEEEEEDWDKEIAEVNSNCGQYVSYMLFLKLFEIVCDLTAKRLFASFLVDMSVFIALYEILNLSHLKPVALKFNRYLFECFCLSFCFWFQVQMDFYNPFV